MKAVLSALILLLGINLIYAISAEARFAHKETKQVPITRLLKNIEAQRSDAVTRTDKALVDFRIGRLHAMAYALKVDTAPCDSAAIPNSRFELPDFGHQPDHIQFQVTKSKEASKISSARQHLNQAIKSLEAAVKTDPDLMIAKLGLAWCQDQAGNKSKALSLYREVFKTAYEDEKNAKGGMYNWSITLETASYLKPILDPLKDKKELASIDSKVQEIEKLPRYITPIVIPVANETALESLLEDKVVSFDLDGQGARNYKQWISPKAAWLVFDAEGNGEIDSGLKLIGQCSFWLFWQNGYEVMRSLDDNGDGKLNGSELEGLALWQDANSNGKSDRGEILSLSELGIEGLAVDSEPHASGILHNSAGVLLKDGTSLPSYDVLLPSR